MADSRYGIYRAPDTDNITTSFISDIDVAVVLETHEIEKETVNEVVESLREALKIDTPSTLDEFQSVLTKELSPLTSDAQFSAASGLVVGDVIYVIVVGGGSVFVHRNNTVQQIIEGDVNASGRIEEHDIFIFQTQTGKKSISDKLLKESIDKGDLMLAAEFLTDKVGDKTGSACLLVSFAQKEQPIEAVSGSLDEQLHKDEQIEQQVLALKRDVGSDQKVEVAQVVQNNQPEVKNERESPQGKHEGKLSRLTATPRSKKLTFAAVILLVIILTWSVIFGVQRRENEAAKQKINTARELIAAKLEEATNVAPLNIERATVLIQDAQQEVDALHKSIGKSHAKEVEQLASLVKQSSNKIINKQDKSFEVFYDLSLIDKSAVADKFYLSDDILTLLNSKKGEIYIISALKKSNDVIKKKEIQGSLLVGSYNEKTFILNKDKGIYTIDTDGKLEHPIKEGGYAKPQAMNVFNTNIYVLDSDAGDILKYLSAEEGYSDKSSYFGDSQADLLKGASDFAIDSSVYVLVDGTVIKYVSGTRDTFKLSLPDQSAPRFSHIYTNQDLDKIFLLDASSGKVVIVAKNGEYNKQIESSIFKQATQFVVFDNKILILVGQKIYSVAL